MNATIIFALSLTVLFLFGLVAVAFVQNSREKKHHEQQVQNVAQAGAELLVKKDAHINKLAESIQTLKNEKYHAEQMRDISQQELFCAKKEIEVGSRLVASLNDNLDQTKIAHKELEAALKDDFGSEYNLKSQVRKARKALKIAVAANNKPVFGGAVQNVGESSVGKSECVDHCSPQLSLVRPQGSDEAKASQL